MAAGRGGNCLQQVGLAQSDIGMNEQRVEADGAGSGLCNGLGGGQRHPVGRAFDIALEGVARIQRRPDDIIGGLQALLEVGKMRPHALQGEVVILASGSRGLLSSGCGGRAVGFCFNGWTDRPGCRAHNDLDLQDIGVFFAEQRADLIEILVVDPGFKECSRHRQPHDTLGCRLKLEPSEPACENFRSDLRLQTRHNPVKGIGVLVHVRPFVSRRANISAKRLDVCFLYVPLCRFTRCCRVCLHRRCNPIAAFR